jgi:hypothetical protein
LLKCRHIVESEFEEQFSEAFIKAIQESEEAYKTGEFVRVAHSAHRRKIFDAL